MNRLDHDDVHCRGGKESVLCSKKRPCPRCRRRGEFIHQPRSAERVYLTRKLGASPVLFFVNISLWYMELTCGLRQPRKRLCWDKATMSGDEQQFLCQIQTTLGLLYRESGPFMPFVNALGCIGDSLSATPV